jgi:acyl-coenzyme A thioesterase PaaI-like protein
MNVTEIPFAKYIGITREDENVLKLDFQPNIENHINTIHASAQFALAETQSGLYLQKLYPEYEGKVLALLRDSTVKFRHPAKTSITAHANIEEEVQTKFLNLFEKRGKASIKVEVEVKDQEGTITMQGQFSWFVQKL